ncbi:MAG: hypothetical protein KQH63_22100 [Desulfobulbaceae bacterium]|nr:hypothetical protein [Desulfobulbaceae bacterium]
MTETINNREASATIRGYIYQFDATIKKILASGDADLCTVEDVEDFDIHSPDLSSYFQCKYYAAQKLTASVLRDAILPMVENYVALSLSERGNKRYFLYGHFKESSYESTGITLDTIKNILVRREKFQEESGEISYQSINLQDEIGATDGDLEGFALQFTLELCSEYEVHKNTVIGDLASNLNVSQFEAENYIYPSALTLISTLACKESVESRTITKGLFLQKVRPNQALYSLWALREKSQRAYCREMRSRYFSKVNIEPEARFFVLDLPGSTSEAEILQILRLIRRKWSSHMVKRKPDRDRYAPYVFLCKTNPEQLTNIKRILLEEGCVFRDGYPFQHSNFSVSSISQQQTYQNKISMRFINSKDDLFCCFNALNQPKSIYQFFIDTPLSIEEEITQVCIPISSPSMITDIV